jgi:hypothetical protein
MRSLRYLLCLLVLSCTLPLAAQNFSEHSYPALGSHLLTADFNRDGHSDLLEWGANNATAFVAINDGHGGFPTTRPIGSAPLTAVAIADFNNDGYPDVAACAVTSAANVFPQTYAIHVYLNQAGSGVFTLKQSLPLPANASCIGITTGNLNGDGFADVVVGADDNSRAHQGLVFTFFGSSTGTLAAPIEQAVSVQSQQQPDATCFLNGIQAADYSGTGRYDLVLYGLCTVDVPGAGTIYYAQNGGAGKYTLTESFEQGPVGFSLVTPLRLVNANDDLLPDLALVISGSFHPGNSFSTLIVTGQGAGKFGVQDVFDENDPGDCNTALVASDVADFDGDGNPDIVHSATVPINGCGSAALPGYVLQTGNGQGSWQISQQNNLPTTSSPPAFMGDVIAADFNNDNHPDFALVAIDNSGALELLVYTNISDSAVSPCLASGPGAHLCTPVASAPSTERITATATGITGPVRLMQLYIDGKKVNQFPGNQVNTAVTVAPGTHTAQVVELEYNGQFAKSATTSFAVASAPACTAPATAGVKICSPVAGSSVTSPVAITAAAKAASGTSVTAMRVYVDNVAKFTVNASTLSTSLPIAAGTHSLAIVGYEANGAALKTTETITVH